MSLAQLGAKNHKYKHDGKLTMAGLHARVKRRLGSASQYRCVDCGKQAQDWSNVSHKYKHEFDFVPRCKSCHAIYDKKGVGVKMPQATRKKISLALKGKPRKSVKLKADPKISPVWVK